MGLSPRKTPLPLAVGSAVHAGLAVLLMRGQALWLGGSEHEPMGWMDVENSAVDAALAEMALHSEGMELDLSEQVAQSKVEPDMEALLRESLSQDDVSLATRIDDAKQRFDSYLWQEQCALVEAMVRAYARRRLKPLLEQYEVLEVEREGDWLLTEWNMVTTHDEISNTDSYEPRAIRFASRPDALLRDRESNQLYIQSFKTAASWDIRKERDAERDMQGLSEGVEVERRLAEWWEQLPDASANYSDALVAEKLDTTVAMAKYLRSLDSAPRILGIRMEYLFKGDRWKDKDLTRALGIESRVQKSPLVRAYLNSGMASGDEQWCHSYDYHKEDGSTSKLYWKTWRPAAVWEHMPIKKWIDMLDQTVEVTGEEGRALGWQGPAQSAGYTDAHPLDDVFHPPLVVYRNDDQLRDWFEQTEAQERAVAEHVEAVNAADSSANTLCPNCGKDHAEGIGGADVSSIYCECGQQFTYRKHDERRSKLNMLFPMYRQSCEYPTTCPFVPVCYGPEHVQRDPMSTGRYKVREANHPQEASCNVSE